MSFKLPRYASSCLGFATFQVQAYFETGAQSHKTLGLGFGFTLPSVAERPSMYEVAHVDFFPPLVLFYEGNLLLFFLNPIRVEGANIRTRRIKQFGSGHVAFIQR